MKSIFSDEDLGKPERYTNMFPDNVTISQQTFVGLQDVLRTSSRHVLKTSSTRLQCNNFSSSKTSCKYVFKTSSRRFARCLQDVFKTLSRRICKTSSRRLGRGKIVTLKTPWRNVLKTCLEGVLKTSWR